MKIRFFDVCILGRGIGGLMAALLLQKQRAKVLVLTKRHARPFDPAVCEYLNGFTLKPALKRVGFHPTEVNAIPALKAPVQLVFEDRRIDCYGREDAFERELVREFPSKVRQITQMFKESQGHVEVYQHLFNSRVPLPPKGFFAKRQFNKVLEQVCDPHLLENRSLTSDLKGFDVGDDFARAVEALQLSLTYMVSDWTSGSKLAHLFTVARWEGYAAPEGLVSIRDMLLQKISEHGGIVAECDEITEIETERSKLKGLKIAGCEWGEIHFDAAIVSGNPRGLTRLAPKFGPFQKWEKEISKIPIFSRKAFQTYRVRREGVPLGMNVQGLIVPPGPPPGMIERRRRVRATRYVLRHLKSTNGKPGDILVGTCSFLSPDGVGPDPQEVSSETRDQLRTVMPFLDQHLCEEPALPYIPNPEGEPGDFRSGLIYSSDGPPFLGVTGLRTETPIKNVFFAGDAVFPGLGLDGEVIAGLHCAIDAARHFQKGEKLG